MTTPLPSPAARTGTRQRRALVRAVILSAVAALIAAAPVLGVASPAQAHNYLVSSAPSAGETLTELPEKFEITTNEALLDLGGKGAGFAMLVRDASGLYYGDGCVSVVGATMSVTAAIGAPGQYTVLWQAVSADGHTVSAEYAFTWAPAAPAPVTVGTAAPADCGGASDGAAAPAPAAPVDDAPTPNADLGDVLWIGGAVVAIGLAIGITLFMVGRKKK